MDFKFNLVHKEVVHELKEDSVVSLPMLAGKTRATVMPDTGQDSESYTLSLLDADSSDQLPSADGIDLDYEFIVQHQTKEGKIDEAFLADEPHTRILTLTGNQLSAKLTVLPPHGEKKFRAYLALADADGKSQA